MSTPVLVLILLVIFAGLMWYLDQSHKHYMERRRKLLNRRFPPL